MGVWGVGIFEDDLAMDVRHMFNTALSKSHSIGIATDVVLHTFRDYLEDEDRRPVVYFALAELQLQSNELHRDIANEVSRLIRQGYDLESWSDARPEDLKGRKLAVNDLLKRISESKVSERITSPELHQYLNNVPNSGVVYVLEDEGEVRYVGSTLFPEARKRDVGLITRNFRRRETGSSDFRVRSSPGVWRTWQKLLHLISHARHPQ